MGRRRRISYREQIQDAFLTIRDVYGTPGNTLGAAEVLPRDYGLDVIARDASALAAKAVGNSETYDALGQVVVQMAEIGELEQDAFLWAREREKTNYTPARLLADLETLRGHMRAIRHDSNQIIGKQWG